MVAVAAAVVGGVIAASGDAGTAITVAQATAFIRAVELQPSDLPGSAPYQAEEGSPPEAAEFQTLLRCGHRGKPRGATVDAERSVLADRYRNWIGEVVASVVIVMPSEALAKAEIATLRSSGGRACMAHDLGAESLPSGPNAPRYALTITSTPDAQLLGPEAVVVHRLARLQRSPRVHLRRGRGFPPPAKLAYVAEAIFRVGAADIVFVVEGEHRVFPAATERRLLTVLHDRAQAHAL